MLKTTAMVLTVTIKDGNGNTTTAIIKDGATGAKG